MVTWSQLAAAAAWVLYIALATGGDAHAAVVGEAVRTWAILAAIILAFVVAAAAAGGVCPRRPARPSDWGSAIAALPLAILLHDEPRPLDHRAALGRGAANPVATAGATSRVDADDAPTVALDRLGDHVGAMVAVSAMAVRPVGRLEQLLPPGQPVAADPAALLRFRITCCAADAVPVAVPMDGLPTAAITDGMWVEVRGRVLAVHGSLFIAVHAWRRIPPPRLPYLAR